MNLNSLIIVADASRARLFRTAQTNEVAEPVELIEIEAIEGPEQRLGGPDALNGFARQIARCAAGFAQYHFCNPVIVAAPGDIYDAIQSALARELPHAYTRSVIGDIAQLPPRKLLRDLQERGAFAAVRHQHPA
jgi:hypothetical protein